jgi:D-sedoheptulose 7-phosphate isomerase
MLQDADCGCSENDVGYDGGRIVGERLADHAVVVRSDYIPRIQEVQASVYHVLRGLIETLMRERG